MIVMSSPNLGPVPICPTRHHARRGHRPCSYLILSRQLSHLNSPDATLITHIGKRRCECFDMHKELVPYAGVWSWQKSIVEERKVLLERNEDCSDTLVILQHHPVYTLGTSGSKEYLNFDIDNAPYNVYRTERGGEVTYHGPGHLVMYPIINLRYQKLDLHWYLRALEEVIIRVLFSTFYIKASRIEGLTGVWVGDQKLAAVGIRVSQWITYHGVALNVTTDLTPFQGIVPCGIRDSRVGSISGLLREFLLSDECGTAGIYHYDDHQLIGITHNSLVKEFCEVFQLELCYRPIPVLNFFRE